MNFRTRDYEIEKQSSQKLNFVEIIKHPLIPHTTIVKHPSVIDNPLMPSNDFINTPSTKTSSKTSSLTTLISLEDPLSMFQQSVQVSELNYKEKTALKGNNSSLFHSILTTSKLFLFHYAELQVKFST